PGASTASSDSQRRSCTHSLPAMNSSTKSMGLVVLTVERRSISLDCIDPPVTKNAGLNPAHLLGHALLHARLTVSRYSRVSGAAIQNSEENRRVACLRQKTCG